MALQRPGKCFISDGTNTDRTDTAHNYIIGGNGWAAEEFDEFYEMIRAVYSYEELTNFSVVSFTVGTQKDERRKENAKQKDTDKIVDVFKGTTESGDI